MNGRGSGSVKERYEMKTDPQLLVDPAGPALQQHGETEHRRLSARLLNSLQRDIERTGKPGILTHATRSDGSSCDTNVDRQPQSFTCGYGAIVMFMRRPYLVARSEPLDPLVRQRVLDNDTVIVPHQVHAVWLGRLVDALNHGAAVPCLFVFPKDLETSIHDPFAVLHRPKPKPCQHLRTPWIRP